MIDCQKSVEDPAWQTSTQQSCQLPHWSAGSELELSQLWRGSPPTGTQLGDRAVASIAAGTNVSTVLMLFMQI